MNSEIEDSKQNQEIESLDNFQVDSTLTSPEEQVQTEIKTVRTNPSNQIDIISAIQSEVLLEDKMDLMIQLLREILDSRTIQDLDSAQNLSPDSTAKNRASSILEPTQINEFQSHSLQKDQPAENEAQKTLPSAFSQNYFKDIKYFIAGALFGIIVGFAIFRINHFREKTSYMPPSSTTLILDQSKKVFPSERLEVEKKPNFVDQVDQLQKSIVHNTPRENISIFNLAKERLTLSLIMERGIAADSPNEQNAQRTISSVSLIYFKLEWKILSL